MREGGFTENTHLVLAVGVVNDRRQDKFCDQVDIHFHNRLVKVDRFQLARRG